MDHYTNEPLVKMFQFLFCFAIFAVIYSHEIHKGIHIRAAGPHEEKELLKVDVSAFELINTFVSFISTN